MIGLISCDPALVVELECPVQVAVIGDRRGVHAGRFDLLDEVGDAVGPVEQAVVRVAMEMNERRAAVMGVPSMSRPVSPKS